MFLMFISILRGNDRKLKLVMAMMDNFVKKVWYSFNFSDIDFQEQSTYIFFGYITSCYRLI